MKENLIFEAFGVENGQNSPQDKHEDKPEKKFRKGDMVKAKNQSSGKIESDWEVANIFEENGEQVVRLRKEEEARGKKYMSQQKISWGELEEINP